MNWESFLTIQFIGQYLNCLMRLGLFATINLEDPWFSGKSRLNAEF